MKKAKIMLSAVGILSVIAGAFAFKAQHKFGGGYFCTALLTTATIKYAPAYTTTGTPTVSLFCTNVQGTSASAKLAVHQAI